MQGLLRRLMTLPSPAMTAVAVLLLAVPFSCFMSAYFVGWQSARNPSLAVALPIYHTIILGRCVGAIALASLLVFRRTPATVSIAITATWVAGPPLDFLLGCIRSLALTAGKSAWIDISYQWIGPSSILPIFITAILLLPESVRQAYSFSKPTDPR